MLTKYTYNFAFLKVKHKEGPPMLPRATVRRTYPKNMKKPEAPRKNIRHTKHEKQQLRM